jgi:hypothetical protein
MSNELSLYTWFIDENDFIPQNVEPYNDARYNAVFDIYNAISFSCMYKIMTDICEP